MSDKTQKKAKVTSAQIGQVAKTILPEHNDANAITSLADANPVASAKILERMNKINLNDTQSIVSFGSSAQLELQKISHMMLTDVRNKDLGPVGESLRNIVTTIRGFSVSELDVRRDRSWWDRLLRRATPFAKFTAKFEDVQIQIDKITDNLLDHEHTLLKDIKALDLLYNKTLQFYDELALYIAAGDEKIIEIDKKEIPKMESEIKIKAEDDKVMAAQRIRNCRAARDDLERRVHDLKLTRQVTMQSLPSIRLVQENDKSLVNKINSTLVNTVPLWETQLAQTVTIQRSAETATAIHDASNLTNELLTKNANNLRSSNKVIREEMERSVFDIEAIKKANASLIGTIEDSLKIADEGKAQRAVAEVELKKMEDELRETLASEKSQNFSAGSNMANNRSS
ncbi:MAG: toxic anion resistance protein [Alphaproteobacteria bacterium]|nr:toxic anion resistance protein [Alphaproteobacteria bacterium]MDA9223405.1 toxic anion resistance protein [Tateyamaria sp.]